MPGAVVMRKKACTTAAKFVMSGRQPEMETMKVARSFVDNAGKLRLLILMRLTLPVDSIR